MKALNISAISNSEGQVQALQALGALLEHTSSMIARNEQTLQGFLTTFLEVERDDIDAQEQKEQSILEAYKSLKNLKIPGQTFTPGFTLVLVLFFASYAYAASPSTNATLELVKISCLTLMINHYQCQTLS